MTGIVYEIFKMYEISRLYSIHAAAVLEVLHARRAYACAILADGVH